MSFLIPSHYVFIGVLISLSSSIHLHSHTTTDPLSSRQWTYPLHHFITTSSCMSIFLPTVHKTESLPAPFLLTLQSRFFFLAYPLCSVTTKYYFHFSDIHLHTFNFSIRFPFHNFLNLCYQQQ